MDDLDAELLEVAGGHVDDGVAGKKKGSAKKRRKAAFSSDEESGGDESDEEVSGDDSDDEPIGNKAAKPSMPLKKRMAMSDDEDEEDDFEATIRAELGYGQDLYKDEADKEQLEAMTEMEREMELYERAEKRDELVASRQLRQEMDERQEAEKPGASKQPRVARERRPNKEDTGKSNALKELSAARARKDKAGKQKEKNAKRQRIDDGEEVSDDEPSSDEDKDDEDARLSDSDGDAPKRDSRRRTHDLDQADDEQEEEDPVMTIAMLQKVIVSRTTMERWHKQPFFEDTVKGCYTRVLIGLDPKTHEQVYRVAQIVEAVKDVYNGKQLAPYEFPAAAPGKPRGNGPTTRKHVVLEIGKMRKVFKMEVVSNGAVPQAEFDFFVKKEVAAARAAGCTAGSELPHRSSLDELESKLIAAEDYRYTAVEVKKILEERRVRGAAAPNLTFEKDRLRFERDKALEAGADVDKVSALEEEILVLESKLAEGREGPRALSKINKRNTNNNYNTTNKAGEEASRAARDPTLVKHKHDPFVRRPTQLSNYWTTAATPAALEVSHADQQAPPPPQQKQRGDVAQLTAASKSCAGVRALTEAHRAVQLHIDMSLITTALAPSLSTPKGRLPPGVTPFNVPQPYHVRITLGEWRTRQGLDQDA